MTNPICIKASNMTDVKLCLFCFLGDWKTFQANQWTLHWIHQQLEWRHHVSCVPRARTGLAHETITIVPFSHNCSVSFDSYVLFLFFKVALQTVISKDWRGQPMDSIKWHLNTLITTPWWRGVTILRPGGRWKLLFTAGVKRWEETWWHDCVFCT